MKSSAQHIALNKGTYIGVEQKEKFQIICKSIIIVIIIIIIMSCYDIFMYIFVYFELQYGWNW